MQTSRKGQITLSLIVCVGFFATLCYFLSLRQTLPTEHRELIAGMIGALTIQFGSVLNWWFSANEGSARTKELLARATIPPEFSDECFDDPAKPPAAPKGDTTDASKKTESPS